MNEKPRTLLVIPSYRDSGRLAPFLDELLQKLPAHFSIRVVDDGSGPAEAKKAEALVCAAQTRASACELAPLLCLPVNRGKGGAIRAAWKSPHDCDVLAFTDADGAVCVREIIRAEGVLRADPQMDALFGSRVKQMGRVVERHLYRHLVGRVFATAASVLTGLAAYDTQCGLKFIRQGAYEKIHSKLMSERFAFDVELLLLLIKSGARVQEVPVDWHEVGGGKLQLATDAPKMLADLIRIVRTHGRV